MYNCVEIHNSADIFRMRTTELPPHQQVRDKLKYHETERVEL